MISEFLINYTQYFYVSLRFLFKNRISIFGEISLKNEKKNILSFLCCSFLLLIHDYPFPPYPLRPIPTVPFASPETYREGIFIAHVSFGEGRSLHGWNRTHSTEWKPRKISGAGDRALSSFCAHARATSPGFSLRITNETVAEAVRRNLADRSFARRGIGARWFELINFLPFPFLLSLPSWPFLPLSLSFLVPPR